MSDPIRETASPRYFEPDPAAKPPVRMARRFKLIIAVAILLVAGWTGLWFTGRHYVEKGIAEAVARVAAKGGTVSCGGEQERGYPFRMTVDCAPFALDLPDRGLSLTLPGLEAITLLYNPGHAISAAKGPLTLKGPDGMAVTANWTSLESSLSVGLSHLKRLSIASDGLDATIAAPGRPDLPNAIKQAHGELHLMQNSSDDKTLDVFVDLAGLVVSRPDRPALPEAKLDAHLILPGALPIRERGHVDPLAGWLTAGEKIGIDNIALDMGGFSAMTTGNVSFDDKGQMSGQLTVRVDQLDRLPDLAEAIKPGSHDKVAEVIGPLSAFMKPVTIDGRDWRETTITIRAGRAFVGFIPIGKIPRLKLRQNADGPSA